MSFFRLVHTLPLPKQKSVHFAHFHTGVLKLYRIVCNNYLSEEQLHLNDREVIEQTEIQVKYSGYIAKEKNNADKLTRLEYVKIPANFDYSQIKSMSYEAREKLKKIQPTTVSQASRISGVSPNDVSVLLVYMGR